MAFQYLTNASLDDARKQIGTVYSKASEQKQIMAATTRMKY